MYKVLANVVMFADLHQIVSDYFNEWRSYSDPPPKSSEPQRSTKAPCQMFYKYSFYKPVSDYSRCVAVHTPPVE